jgi:hypothetical protein
MENEGRSMGYGAPVILNATKDLRVKQGVLKKNLLMLKKIINKGIPATIQRKKPVP